MVLRNASSVMQESLFLVEFSLFYFRIMVLKRNTKYVLDFIMLFDRTNKVLFYIKVEVDYL